MVLCGVEVEPVVIGYAYEEFQGSLIGLVRRGRILGFVGGVKRNYDKRSVPHLTQKNHQKQFAKFIAVNIMHSELDTL